MRTIFLGIKWGAAGGAASLAVLVAGFIAGDLLTGARGPFAALLLLALGAPFAAGTGAIIGAVCAAILHVVRGVRFAPPLAALVAPLPITALLWGEQTRELIALIAAAIATAAVGWFVGQRFREEVIARQHAERLPAPGQEAFEHNTVGMDVR